MNSKSTAHTTRKSAKNAKRASKSATIIKFIVFAAMASLIVVICFAVMFLALYKPSVSQGNAGNNIQQGDHNDIEQNIPDNGDIPPVTSAGSSGSSADRKKDFYTFLIIGRDDVGLNTDIIMLASFDIANKEINVMQIPRDTYIQIDNSAYKINSVYAAMHSRAYSKNPKSDLEDIGLRQFIAVLEKNLGVCIDNYALFSLSGFRNIIDLLGGVEMDIPYDMYYSDPDQGLYINLKQGPQVLDGAKAEQFMRFRSGYIQGDVGRVNAQKLFFTALVQQLKNKLNVTTAVGLIGEAVKNVTTSMSVLDLTYFAKEFFLCKSANINLFTLPGTDARADVNSGAWYYIMHRADALALINRYMNAYEDDIAASQFDPDRIFTCSRAHINAIYDAAESENPLDCVYSAQDISDNGLQIPLLN